MTTPPLLVDLISDTATRPNQAMRTFMANAPVGDEQLAEDPSVNTLNARVATLLNKEAALFLPSGTMANQIAIAVHCRSGDAIVAARQAHIVGSEGAGAAVFAGTVIQGVETSSGVFDAQMLAQQWREPRIKAPRVSLISVEQTTNRGGGAIWPLATLQEVAAFARERNLPMHMDGARLLNAVVASGVSAADYAQTCDTVWIDLSKGLGCPIGSVLAGSHAFIEQAEIWKHRFGGAMRQAGIVAAAGIYALDYHVEDLAQDHQRAQRLAAFIRDRDDLTLAHDNVQTNLVFFNIKSKRYTAQDLAQGLRSKGVRVGVQSSKSVRAVFHRDINDEGLELALSALEETLDTLNQI